MKRKSANNVDEYFEKIKPQIISNIKWELRYYEEIKLKDAINKNDFKYIKYYQQHIDTLRNILNNEKSLNNYVWRHCYNFKKSLPAKDNYNIYEDNSNRNLGDPKSPIIRVPSLKRKTAWKRFYKLYPALKGLSKIEGSYSTWGGGGKFPCGINPSTIKLKKI